VILAALSLLLSVAPPGIVVADDAALVTQTASRLPSLFGAAPGLKPLLAPDEDTRAFLSSLGVGADDLPTMMGAIKASQEPPPPLSPAFVPQHALVVTKKASKTLVFFAEDGRRVVVSWLATNGRSVLLEAPNVGEESLASALPKARSQGATYFMRSDAGWRSAPLPVPACADVLEVAAREVWMAQTKRLIATQRYASTVDELKIKEAVLQGVTVTIQSASATAFTAELSSGGGIAQMNEKKTYKLVKPCAP
jgi:hypothetical protein